MVHIVVTGLTSNGMVQITSGLRAGEQVVVTRGGFGGPGGGGAPPGAGTGGAPSGAPNGASSGPTPSTSAATGAGGAP